MGHRLRTDFMIVLGLGAVALVVILLSPSPVQALPGYALERRDVGEKADIDQDWSILRVYDRKTGRTVWSRRCSGAYSPSWSQDRRSFAIVVENVYGRPSYPGQFRLLYWRAGQAVRLVPHPGLFADFDEVINLRWSPDGRRFAFLGGSTAFGSGGPYIGCLCCVDAVTGHFFFGPTEAGNYRWADARRLRYLVTRVVPDPRHPKGMYGVLAVERPRYWSGAVTDNVWKDPEWLRGKVRLHGRLWPW